MKRVRSPCTVLSACEQMEKILFPRLSRSKFALMTDR